MRHGQRSLSVSAVICSALVRACPTVCSDSGSLNGRQSTFTLTSSSVSASSKRTVNIPSASARPTFVTSAATSSSPASTSPRYCSTLHTTRRWPSVETRSFTTDPSGGGSCPPETSALSSCRSSASPMACGAGCVGCRCAAADAVDVRCRCRSFASCCRSFASSCRFLASSFATSLACFPAGEPTVLGHSPATKKRGTPSSCTGFKPGRRCTPDATVRTASFGSALGGCGGNATARSFVRGVPPESAPSVSAVRFGRRPGDTNRVSGRAASSGAPWFESLASSFAGCFVRGVPPDPAPSASALRFAPRCGEKRGCRRRPVSGVGTLPAASPGCFSSSASGLK